MAEMTGFLSGNAMLDLRPDEMVLQLAGDEAVIAQLPNYLADPAFKNLYDVNPYYDKSRAVMPRAGARQRMYARPTKKKEAPAVVAGAIDKVDPLLKDLLDKSRRN
jgi:type IV secretion system protein VirD4